MLDVPDYQLAAYEKLYLIENLLRLTLHYFLFDTHGEGYFNSEYLPAFHDDRISGRKVDPVNTAIKRAERDSISYDDASDARYLLYVDFPVLVGLVNQLWDLGYNNMIREKTKNINSTIIPRLFDLSIIRNAIAHNRKVTQELSIEIESTYNRLKRIFKTDVLATVSDYIDYSDISIRFRFTTVLNELLEKLKQRLMADDLESRIRIYYKITLLTGLKENVEYLADYNSLVIILGKYNRLPRIEGRGDIIDKYIKESDLGGTIMRVISHLGGE